MRPTTMTAEELELRLELERYVDGLRAAIDSCPILDALDPLEFQGAGEVISAANDALIGARTVTSALQALTNLTEESVLLVSSSSMALALIGEALTLITAEFDGRVSEPTTPA